jgi:nucleoside-diphosphate-sugar epimerase
MLIRKEMRVAPPTERVAITGANGFTGFALTEALKARGQLVSGFGRQQDPAWGVDGDLTDYKALFSFFSETSPNAVVHLAGISSPVHGSVAEIYNANVTGTATLLQALKDTGIMPKVVIVASSATVYSESSGNISEYERIEPRTHYAISKRAVERICELYSSELNIRIVRPFNYTGVGQSSNFLIPKIVSHFAHNTGSIELGNLELERDISDLVDVVECYCRLIEHPGGPVVNICSGQTVKLASIVDMLREISGRQKAVKKNPLFFRSREPYRICGDRAALDDLIGTWSRRKVMETLSSMYNWSISEQRVPGSG